MTGTRQTIQYSLALEPAHQGETRVSGYQGAEPVVAKPAPESPASAEQLMEEVCDRENLVRAWKRVRQNKRSPGVDEMTIDEKPGSCDFMTPHHRHRDRRAVRLSAAAGCAIAAGGLPDHFG